MAAIGHGCGCFSGSDNPQGQKQSDLPVRKKEMRLVAVTRNSRSKKAPCIHGREGRAKQVKRNSTAGIDPTHLIHERSRLPLANDSGGTNVLRQPRLVTRVVDLQELSSSTSVAPSFR